MAGIYIHIPFCKKACHYCNFHFSTSLKNKNEVIQQLLKEIRLRKDYLKGENIETIYFGGGTPSLLTENDIEQIQNEIYKTFHVNSNIECTLEANPDDLNTEKMLMLKKAGINRLSIGIQSFYDEDLQYMNRSHDATQAEQCIRLAEETGFDNYSIDLIFGFPLLTHDKWKQNIEKALQHKVPHLSCYAMTVEPKTALASFIKNKKAAPVDNEQSATQFEYLMKTLQQNGYEHYEISNYALPGKRAVHNSNYWKGKSYLGIGPSAHSYNGETRQWNVANNIQYVKSLAEDKLPFELEILSETQKMNEMIMISLRTKEGLNFSLLQKRLNEKQMQEWNKSLKQFVDEDYLQTQNGIITLTQKGKLFADYVAGEMFVEE